jgi:hypothetical protein
MSGTAHPSTIPVRPEELDEFRQGRLLLVFSALDPSKPAQRPDLERLSYYDFFAANPFLVPTDAPTKALLTHAGFEASNLSYQSSSQRFTNNRSRLQFDLAILVALGLVAPELHDRRVTYGATAAGKTVAASFRSLYASAFLDSSALIVDRLKRMSDTALRRDAGQWLRAEALMIDLYDRDMLGQ